MGRVRTWCGRAALDSTFAHRLGQKAGYDARHDDYHDLHSWKRQTGMRTGKNARDIYSRRARMRSQLRFTRTGDEMRTYCEQGDRVKNELEPGWAY